MERLVLLDIFGLYKDFPCLWDTSSEYYYRKDAKQEALSVLLERWKEIDPNANHDTVKRKLDNMRTTFFREWKKVESSKSLGGGADSIYKPTLWYYKNMQFLVENQKYKRNAAETKRAPARAASSECSSNDNDHSQHTRAKIQKIKGHKRFRTEQKHTKRKHGKTWLDGRRHESTETGSEDILARAFTSQLREMTKLQRCIAEKLIAEVFFYGKLELLTLQSIVAVNNANRNDLLTPPSTSREFLPHHADLQTANIKRSPSPHSPLSHSVPPPSPSSSQKPMSIFIPSLSPQSSALSMPSP